MTRVFVVVEGPSEERFVKNVLAPHLAAYSREVLVSIVKTSREPGGLARRGGGGNVRHYLDDLRDVLRNPSNS